MVFSNLIEVSGIYIVDLAIKLPRDVVYRLFAFVCFVFHGAAFIRYVQAAIFYYFTSKASCMFVCMWL